MAVSLNEDGQPAALIWHLVRIFSEPLEPGQAGLISKKAGRRKARMQRRQIDRRAARLRRIAHLANLFKLNREEILPDNGRNLPCLRAQAATEKVKLEDLLRILLRLSKRRGYRGEFRAKKKGEVAEGSNELKQVMRALAIERNITLKDDDDTGITLGQYLLHRLENQLPTKLKIREVGDEPKGKAVENTDLPKNLYVLRSMVEHEFNTIWNTQIAHHDILKGAEGKSIRDHFYDALFYQRPLKSAAELVAQCSLEPTLSRAPRAQMAFQRFRIEKTLADLRWGAGKRAETLSLEQKQIIRDLLDHQDKATFESIYETLEKMGLPKPQGKGLNLDRASREELPGNTTLAAFRELDKYSAKHHSERAGNLEKAFRTLDEKTQIAVINFLAELGSPEQLDDPAWHTNFVKRDGAPRKLSEPLVEFINRIKEHDQFDRLNKMNFDGGRASYSVKALNKLADWLQAPVWAGDWNKAEDGAMSVDEEGAVRACYREQIKKQPQVVQQSKLPIPKSTGNAVVDGALRQIRWVVNKMIDEVGAPPEEIVVELSREMSLGITRRNEREMENTKNQKARRQAEKEIRANGSVPTSSRIRRYLLWQEQDTCCPYCDRKIELREALCADTEYEHIIPKSLTQVGLKRSEITLAHQVCNQAKEGKTPWEAWGNAPRWAHIEQAAERLEKKKLFRKAKLLRLRDFERETLTDESINDFADRQLHQTSWIAKEATQWLACLCPNRVYSSRGELTAVQRRSWKLETLIPEVRYESDLPVLDEGGKLDNQGKILPPQPITQEEFQVLKKHLEGHPIRREDREANPGFDFNRRPDKRIDHRHHLIDAITLALTSRSLFQQMARNYKLAAEKLQPRNGETAEEREKRVKNETRLRLEIPEPPLRDVRSAALKAVRECRISIKHDRYPDGALFKATAYGIAQRDSEDRLRLVLRAAVADLGKAQGKTSLESARNAISKIVSNEVREIISDTFELRINQGKVAGEALAQPIFHPHYNKPIKKIRCYENFAEDAQAIVSSSRRGEHRKYLINDGYAYLDLSTDGSQKHQLIKVRDAVRNKKRVAAKNSLRLYKGDTVLDSKDGLLYRVCLFKAAGTIALLPIWEPRSFKEANEKARKGSKVGCTISFAPAAKRLKRID
jgi:CRISPR-associated endonuclease Csn1